MVLPFCKIIQRSLSEKKSILLHQIRSLSAAKRSVRNKNALLGTLGVIGGGAGVLLYLLDQSVKASDFELHCPKHTWPHSGLIRSLDHASVRRGYEVFKQVCAACHSLQYVAYRNLVGVTHSEAEAKAEAEEQMIEDGPDEAGNMFKRPGKLSDCIPAPYPNENAARAANGGAYPPDLTYITLARHGGENYIFALLTGYCEPPAGVSLREGLHYNPYFLGGAFSMAQPLFEDSAVYSDGTKAHASQLAKDVSTFLKWTAEPEFDDRQLMMIKMIGYFAFAAALVYYLVRMKFIALKTRQIQLIRKPSSKPKCKP